MSEPTREEAARSGADTIRPRRGGRRAALLVFAFVTLSSLGCDQLTKDLARQHLAGAPPSWFAMGTVELTFAENAGGFLSLGAALPPLVRKAIFVTAVPIALALLCGSVLRQPGLARVDALAVALVAGGGLGNWIDRVWQQGVVTDFLRVEVGPLRTGIFNVADVAIMAGVALLVVRIVLDGRKVEPEVALASGSDAAMHADESQDRDPG